MLCLLWFNILFFIIQAPVTASYNLRPWIDSTKDAFELVWFLSNYIEEIIVICSNVFDYVLFMSC